MAALGEVPFRRYYGSVDSTPLFVMLAAQYFERTADLETIRGIWPNILAALEWIDHYGDVDGDGFVEYARMTDKGLSNQGWKDSSDSIFHRDGRLAMAPIALCEVQGYVFAASKRAVLARGSATATVRKWRAKPRSCGSSSRKPSGSRSWALTPSRSTATSAGARCWPPMPATACSPGLPRLNARSGSRNC